MMAARRTFERFDRISTRVLMAGVIASAVLLAAGLFLWGTGAAQDETVLAAGLIVLMLTPAARLIVSFVEYVLLRDWFFVATTATVVLILLASVLSAVLWG